VPEPSAAVFHEPKVYPTRANAFAVALTAVPPVIACVLIVPVADASFLLKVTVYGLPCQIAYKVIEAVGV
jgi:hypothetical protein